MEVLRASDVLGASESFKSHDCDSEEFPVPTLTLMTYPPNWFPDYEHSTIIPLDPPAAADALPDKRKIPVDCEPLDPLLITNEVIQGICIICFLEDEHSSRDCPYQKYIPKNATASGCDIVCTICGSLFSGRCCNQDAGCAKLKLCHNCLRFGDHWASQCPEEDRSLIDVDF